MRNKLPRSLRISPRFIHHCIQQRSNPRGQFPASSSQQQLHLQHPTRTRTRTRTSTTTHVVELSRHISLSSSTYLSHNPPAKPPSSPRSSSPETKTTIMSSDDAYAAFLDKANEDPYKNTPATTQQPEGFVHTKTTDETTAVPTVLRDVEMYYISDTDEVFEPVVLSWSGAAQGRWPGVDEFKSLILPSASTTETADMQITILTPSSFDPKNQYATVLHAVKVAAGGGANGQDTEGVEVKVYRVQMSRTRVEYWVVGLDGRGNGGRVVGLKARAVES
ncbi:hypothetical protein GX51_06013 [Blastomyces parvus]|uniref:Uncharacterized protein n=1 Tax=Blastomyces parvus TaxID=2060905 RepID=A0A2B7WU59_9EURO|nr:hypothetical protein GX51_06013 [Blastomyces parvus]